MRLASFASLTLFVASVVGAQTASTTDQGAFHPYRSTTTPPTSLERQEVGASRLPLVLGLQLGSPVVLPECERMQVTYPNPDGSPPPYLTVQPHECIMHDAHPINGVDFGVIIFPIDAMPTLADNNWVMDRLIDGRLSSLNVETLDYNHANYIVGQLTAKFGKPDEDGHSSVDLDTIAVPSRTVIWNRPGYRVEYDSVTSSVEHGHILIQTDEDLTDERQRDAAQKAKQTPF